MSWKIAPVTVSMIAVAISISMMVKPASRRFAAGTDPPASRRRAGFLTVISSS